MPADRSGAAWRKADLKGRIAGGESLSDQPTKPDSRGPQPQAVKHWGFAGLLFTYRCPAACASCYVCSGPASEGDMSVEEGLAWWEGLGRACPRGCRIHIGGGEPFVRWEALIELCRRARAAGLGPLEAVETNAFWAEDAALVADRLRQLDQGGLGRLTISADPYHQQFVPIQRPRLAADVAQRVLGPQRVRVRWRDWLAEGFDLIDATPQRRQAVFTQYLARRRDRLTGRASAQLADLLELKPADAFADETCAESLLRSRHVHVDGEGFICPGACAGILLGRATTSQSLTDTWNDLARRHRTMEVIGPLATSGPVGLLRQAEQLGYVRRAGYAGKCHLCHCVRRWLFENGHFPRGLGPAAVYRD